MIGQLWQGEPGCALLDQLVDDVGECVGGKRPACGALKVAVFVDGYRRVGLAKGHVGLRHTSEFGLDRLRVCDRRLCASCASEGDHYDADECDGGHVDGSELLERPGRGAGARACASRRSRSACARWWTAFWW
jgi:hypothetical protein